MSKICSFCSKTVYPMEQLTCLDQFWHKTCFKCHECKCTLNVKNFIPFDKKPYCKVHVPTLKHTVITDTPENQRLAQNTRLTSNIKYHEDFEKTKGVKISVTDDPLSLQQKQNMDNISQVAYHGLRDRKTEMDAARHGERDTGEQRSSSGTASVTTSVITMRPVDSTREAPGVTSPTDHRQSYSTYFSQRKNSQDGSTSVQITSTSRNSANVGRICDYDPRTDGHPRTQSLVNSQNTRNSVPSQPAAPVPEPTLPAPEPTLPATEDNKRVSNPTSTPPAAQRISSRGMTYRAVFDYTKQDSDEVSFTEGDVIMNGDPIDEGWMYGTVERTGEFGMLPSNYVELIQ